MKTVRSLIFLSLVIILSGCASLQTGSEFDAGRQALLKGYNQPALDYFQSVAQRDPNYVYNSPLQENVWSYLGRTEYINGRLPQARQSLEKSLSIDKDQDTARLYLGLTLARSGDRQQGLKEIESGMRGIHDWLEYISQAFRYSYGRFWDPNREIRSAIQGDLAMLSGKDVDMQKLIADGEWLGKRVEEEIDLARRDEREDRFRDGSARQP